MKKITLSIILLVTLTVFYGCEDMLTEKPTSQISPAGFFRDAKDAEAILMGAYDALQSGNYYGRYIFPVNYHAGCISYSRAGDRASIALYIDNQILNQGRSNTPIWSGLYEGIKRANAVLTFVPDIDMDETKKSKILGEAYFLRGMHYLNLVRYFGSVPIVNKLAEGANINEYLYEKSSVKALYDQIIADFNEAVTRLDNRKETGAGRASKQAAQAMLMRTYWAKATDQEAGEPADWTKALNLGKGLLSEFTLEPVFAKLFGELDDNQEVLFEVNFTRTKGESLDVSVHATLAPEFSGIGPDAWGTVHTRLHFWNSFNNDDVRKNVTFLTQYNDKNGKVVNWWEFNSAKAPHFKKWIDFKSVEPNSAFNFPVIRGADILLMLAEIESELKGGPNAEAYGYIDQVRSRAGITLLAGSGLSLEAFRDSVLYERRRELACEAHDFIDLAHFGAAKMKEMAIITSYPKTNEGKQKMVNDIPAADRQQILASPKAQELIDGIFGRQVKTEDIEWDDHNVRLAIPQNAVDVNPNLGKNDPYRPGN